MQQLSGSSGRGGTNTPAMSRLCWRKEASRSARSAGPTSREPKITRAWAWGLAVEGDGVGMGWLGVEAVGSAAAAAAAADLDLPSLLESFGFRPRGALGSSDSGLAGAGGASGLSLGLNRGSLMIIS